MKSFLDINNPFFTAMGKIYDIIVISIIWVISCIPIFTIGAATTAMYYAIAKVIRKDRGYLLREYFKSFKMNFKKATLATIIFLLIGYIINIDFQYAVNMLPRNGLFAYILMGIFGFVSFLTMTTFIYVFPVLSRFDLSLKQLLKNSLLFSLKHLPSTIVMVLILSISFLLVWLSPILFLLIPGICILLISLFMEKIFKKYMPKAEDNPAKTGVDEWYLE